MFLPEHLPELYQSKFQCTVRSPIPSVRTVGNFKTIAKHRQNTTRPRHFTNGSHSFPVTVAWSVRLARVRVSTNTNWLANLSRPAMLDKQQHENTNYLSYNNFFTKRIIRPTPLSRFFCETKTSKHQRLCPASSGKTKALQHNASTLLNNSSLSAKGAK